MVERPVAFSIKFNTVSSGWSMVYNSYDSSWRYHILKDIQKLGL